MATVYDVAEKAGVSIATVSRAMRGQDSVTAEARDRVLAAGCGQLSTSSGQLAQRDSGVGGLSAQSRCVQAGDGLSEALFGLIGSSRHQV